MILFSFAVSFFLLLCLVTCFVVLVQESRSLGLGASFGGDAGDSLFGTSTAQVLKKITAYLAVVFMIFCIALSLWTTSLTTKATDHKQPTSTEIVE